MENQNKYYWFGGLLLAASLLARLAVYPVVVSDYTYFTAKWFDALQTHAWLTAFRAPFSDYAPLYLYFLKVLTFIPVSSLYSIKTLSFLFDIIVAAAACLMIQKTSPISYSRSQLFFAFAVMLSIPTVVINSSLWGQADATYAAGIVLCLYYMLTDRPLGAALAFSAALCLKVQAIFFLPVLVGYMLRDKRNARYLVLPPLLYVVSIIPAWLSGGSLLALLTTYAHEAGEYTGLNISSQSVFAFTSGLPLSASFQTMLFWMGILFALIGALWVIVCVAYPRERPSARRIVFLSLLCVLVVPYFLPRMHERYFYLADVLSVVYAFYSPRQWYLPALVVGASLLAYMPYLSSQVSWLSWAHVDLRVPSLMLLVVLVYMLFGRLNSFNSA